MYITALMKGELYARDQHIVFDLDGPFDDLRLELSVYFDDLFGDRGVFRGRERYPDSSKKHKTINHLLTRRNVILENAYTVCHEGSSAADMVKWC